MNDPVLQRCRSFLVIGLSVLGLLALAYPAPATAQDSNTATNSTTEQSSALSQKRVSSEQLAIEAANVQAEHCADAASVAGTGGLRSISIVSDTWVRVSERYDFSGESYLLYWRGVLAQCMDQEDRALVDLQEFVAGSEGNVLWITLVRDAERRIRRLGGTTETNNKRPSSPEQRLQALGIVLGASLAAGSVASAVGAERQWSVSQDHASTLLQAERAYLVSLPDYASGKAAAQTSRILTVTAVGLGVGSLLSFVLTARNPAGKLTQSSPPLLFPLADGAALAFGGTF
ncbi:MAG: hypothetical protein CMP23_14945 [Rickettsiales bacterium]|nr:hypothetical protein [Rickettsiales bacterium]|tara:strand:+ start:1719 stop:2582 length:864 start_codon:yes stop_codon:yes gene_type:complete